MTAQYSLWCPGLRISLQHGDVLSRGRGVPLMVDARKKCLWYADKIHMGLGRENANFINSHQVVSNWFTMSADERQAFMAWRTTAPDQ